VRAVLDRFPGAEIVGVYDREAEAQNGSLSGETPEDN
jgi:hypothetical protein